MAITSGLKLNVNKIKSPFGSSSAIPKISAGGGLFGIKPQAGIKPSSILSDPGTLVGQVKGDIANIDRTIAVEKRVSANEKKITILKKILQNQKESGNRELAETNDILKDIGNALALDFASRIQDSKDRLAAQKRALAAQRRRDKEEGIEGKDKIDKDKSFLSKTFDKVTAPIKGIFGKIFDFFSILGAGILVKGAFDWLQNPENLDKAKSMFKWLTDNWMWIAGAVALGGVAIAVGGLVTAISGIWAIFTAIGGLLAAIAPVAWPVLAIAAIGLGAWFGYKWLDKQVSGGGRFSELDQMGRDELLKARVSQGGVVTDSKGDALDIPHVNRHGNTIMRMGSVATELDAIRFGEDPDDLAKRRGMATKAEIIAVIGEAEYNKRQKAYLRWQDLMGRKDILKKNMGNEIRLSNAEVEKEFEKEISETNLWNPFAGIKLNRKILREKRLREDRIRIKYDQMVIEEFGDQFNFSGSGQVNGANGKDKISANLTKGEFVINKDSAQKIGSETLTALNSGNAFVSLQKGIEVQSENNKSQKRINDEFKNVLVGFNQQLANVATSRNTGGAMKPTPRSRPNISAVPKQIGGVLVKPRRNIFMDLPLQQAEIDTRTVKENVGLQRQEELLVKSRAGRMGSDIEIGPYDPSNEYWVAQAYDSYGFPGWSDLL